MAKSTTTLLVKVKNQTTK